MNILSIGESMPVPNKELAAMVGLFSSWCVLWGIGARRRRSKLLDIHDELRTVRRDMRERGFSEGFNKTRVDFATDDLDEIISRNWPFPPYYQTHDRYIISLITEDVDWIRDMAPDKDRVFIENLRRLTKRIKEREDLRHK